MLVAYELNKSLADIKEMEVEEIGWWLAFFKYKEEVAEKHREKNSPTKSGMKKPRRR